MCNRFPLNLFCFHRVLLCFVEFFIHVNTRVLKCFLFEHSHFKRKFSFDRFSSFFWGNLNKEMGRDNKNDKKGAEQKEEPRDVPKPRSTRFNLPSIVEQSKLRKKRPYSVYDEVYCDKDRAAAVSIGDFDIKKSLNQKRRQDRTEALQVPEEQDPSNLIALGMREIKGKNLDNGVLFLTKANLIISFE